MVEGTPREGIDPEVIEKYNKVKLCEKYHIDWFRFDDMKAEDVLFMIHMTNMESQVVQESRVRAQNQPANVKESEHVAFFTEYDFPTGET